MKHLKRIGIWMDHSVAHLMEYTMDPIHTKVIHSAFTHQQKESALGKNENLMHHKENHEQMAYYKQIGEAILPYDQVILFGPTQAKHELKNMLNGDHHFDKIQIELINADKMTENQQHAFVKSHFEAVPHKV